MKFNFRPVNEKNKIPREKVVKQLIEGTIIIIRDNKYMFQLKDSTLVLPLTRKSYSCEGYSVIYRPDTEIKNKWIKIIRNSSERQFSAPKCYTPFKVGTKVNGYLCREDNIDKFDLRNNGID